MALTVAPVGHQQRRHIGERRDKQQRQSSGGADPSPVTRVQRGMREQLHAGHGEQPSGPDPTALPSIPCGRPARAFSAAPAERRTDETSRQSGPRGRARQPMNAHRCLPGPPARQRPAAGWGQRDRDTCRGGEVCGAASSAPGALRAASHPAGDSVLECHSPTLRSPAGSAAAQAVAGEQASRKFRLPSRSCCCDRDRDSDRPGTSPRPPHTGLAASGFAPRPPAS